MRRCKRNAAGLSKYVEICRRKVGENVEIWWYHDIEKLFVNGERKR